MGVGSTSNELKKIASHSRSFKVVQNETDE